MSVFYAPLRGALLGQFSITVQPTDWEKMTEKQGFVTQ